MASAKLLETLAVTAELNQTALSQAAVLVMAGDLATYPEAKVLAALERCRCELRGRGSLTIAEIIARIDDGRPGPEEAWARIPRSEDDSVYMTDEMAEAYGVAKPLLDLGDPVAARMAFKECYLRALTAARAARKPVHGWISLGRDPHARELATADAVSRGLISPEAAARLAPPPAGDDDMQKTDARAYIAHATKLLASLPPHHGSCDTLDGQAVRRTRDNVRRPADLVADHQEPLCGDSQNSAPAITQRRTA